MCQNTCVQTQRERRRQPLFERCVVYLISGPVGACQLFLGTGREGGKEGGTEGGREGAKEGG